MTLQRRISFGAPCCVALIYFATVVGRAAGRFLEGAAIGPAPAAASPGLDSPAPAPFVAPTLYDKHGMEWQQGMCFSRERQSPINFDDHLREPPSDTFYFHYEPLKNIKLQMQARQGLIFIDTSRIKAGDIAFNGERYPLVRIDFHIGAEHLIKGKRNSMEVQLVHRKVNDPMQILIISIPVWSEDTPTPAPIPLYLFSRRPVSPLYYPPPMTAMDHNSVLEQFLTVRPPTQEGQIVDLIIPLAKPLDLGAFVVNPFLPDSGTYIQYSGSTTTPPCSDMATWFVRRNPMIASNAQTQAFANSIFRLTNKHGNFRVVMPVNQRPLVVYKAQWVPYHQFGTKPLPLGPNARTDGEYQAAKLAAMAHELSQDAVDYMADVSGRMARSARNMTQEFEKGHRELLATPPPSNSSIHDSAEWIHAVENTRQALGDMANNVASIVDKHMRAETMEVHKLASKEAETARMLTKSWLAASAPPPPQAR